MGIFLRHSWNVKPPRWGSPADVQYAIKVNAEKIYDVDPDSLVLCMPLFWGLPALDYSGKNNHGTNHGAAFQNGSLNFDGVNDYVNYPTNTLLTPTHLTISGRFKITFTSAEYRGFSHNANEPYISFRFNQGANANRLQANLYTDVAVHTLAYTTGDLTDWNNIVLTATENGNAYFYVNGRLQDTVISIGNFLATTQTTTNGNNIGTNRNISGNFTPGLIDEVRISKAAQAADQIALFHDLPWALYQPVPRPVYFFQAAVGGVTMPIFMSNYLRQMGA